MATANPPINPLTHLPEILLFIRDKPFMDAFNAALETHWPTEVLSNDENDTTTTTTTTKKIKIKPVLNTSLKFLSPESKFDLIVSPANSYGRLDGAFDDAISRAFCAPPLHDYNTLTKAVQKVLYDRYKGFAPPGTCTIIEIPDALKDVNPWGCHLLALCPTMRTPMYEVNWDREVVYECIWCLLNEIYRWNEESNNNNNNNLTTGEGKEGNGKKPIKRILMTPLGTGIGKISKERWAAQTVLAMKDFVNALENPQLWSQLDWGDIAQLYEDVEKTWVEGV